MDKKQREKIIRQVKEHRRAQRELDLERGIVHNSHVAKTSKKDKSNRKRKPNGIKPYRIQELGESG